MKGWIARALCWGAVALAPLAAQGEDAHTARIRASVVATVVPLMSRHAIPGMAVAVTLDGRSHVFTYGLASLEPPQPVTATTLFEVGSISKVFTATLAAHAQTTGRLSLDDHPGRYLPQLRGAPIDRATLRQLGTYTAGGLPLQFPDEVGDTDAVLAYFRRWKPAARPGTRREYSNPSPGLLGVVAARALGEDFATAMETRILRPLGMADTFIRVPAARLADYAWGHREDRAVRVNPGPLDEEAYGIKTTAADLLRFVRANIDPTSLDPRLRRTIELTQVGHYRAGPLVQGLGWEQYPDPVSLEWLLGGNAAEMLFEPQPAARLEAGEAGSPRLFNKTGSTGGFGAYVVFSPARRIGVVVLANRSYPIAERVRAGWTLLEQLAPPPR